MGWLIPAGTLLRPIRAWPSPAHGGTVQCIGTYDLDAGPIVWAPTEKVERPAAEVASDTLRLPVPLSVPKPTASSRRPPPERQSEIS